MYNVSVITPTFCGRERLRGVFTSLREQESRPVEWIIVLDGPDAQTTEIVKSFIDSSFPVYLYEIPHNHKKAAVNFGVKHAIGDWVLIADDDDLIPKTAIRDLLGAWNKLPKTEWDRFVGVTGLCDNGIGKLIGDEFPEDEFVSDAIETFFKYNILGEKWGMQRRDIMLRYPFFEDAEGLIGESTVWWEIAKSYKTLYINKVVRHYIIREGSLITSPHSKQRIVSNCQALTYGYYYSSSNFCGKFVDKPKWFVGVTSFYVRYLLHCKFLGKTKAWMRFNPLSKNALLFLIGLPLGSVLFISDLLRHQFRCDP